MTTAASPPPLPAPQPGAAADPAAPSRPAPRSATMRDVAALAGASLKTVSRVVNGEGGVSPALASRVQEALVLLGYRHDLAASSLRRSDRKTATVALLLEDVANPFDAALHRAVEDVARSHSSLVLCGSSDNDVSRERELLRAFAGRRVDGVIAVPAGPDHTALLHEQQLGTPVVFVDRPDTSGRADSIVVDNRGGSLIAVEHLVRHGHRRVALVADRPEVWTAAERTAGHREALLRAGLALDPALVRVGVQGDEAAAAAVRDLLALPDPPTAVFTAQNVLTAGAVRALQVAGRTRDVALVGFDDFPLADLLDPGVTVVAQDIPELGRRVADALFERIAGSDAPARVTTVPVTLVPRGSGEVLRRP